MKFFMKNIKILSSVVLFFFLWTFGPLFQIPTAYAAEKQKPAAGRGSANQYAGNRTQATVSSPEEKLQKSLDRIRDAGTDRVKIKTERAELDKIDGELQKQFKETEAKIKNLPDVIKKRHRDFVKKYAENMIMLRGQLDKIASAKTGEDARVAAGDIKAFLERTKAPSHHQKLDPNNLPFRARKAGKAIAPRLKKEDFERDFPKQKAQNKRKLADSSWMVNLLAVAPKQKPVLLAYNDIASDVPQSLNIQSEMPQFAFADFSTTILAQAADLPTTDDLAETPDIQFTDAIRAKAQELGSAPKIFAWVRNNIKYEAYYGSLKGAQQTFLEGAGNDFDQASLLIALLRAINIPAKYVYGTVEIPIDRVTSWLGVTDSIVAGSILATNGIPATLMKTSGGVYKTVRLEHCWVSAYVNMLPSFGAKNTTDDMAWTPVDPSFKEQNITAQINLSKLVPFNESGYLSNRRNLPPSIEYLFAAEDYHTANYLGNIFKMFYVKRIIEENFEVFLGTLPYQVIATAKQFTEVPDTMRHKININMTDPAMGSTATVQKNTAEITGNIITVSYNPAAAEDEATISNYGGLLKTPSYLVKVKPTVNLNNSVILEGPAVNLGASLRLSVNFIEPGFGMENIETDISAGIYYCIAIAALNPSQDQVSGKLDMLKSLSGTVYDSINSRDDQIGELLHGISIEYFSKANNAAKSLASLMHIQNTNVISGGFVSVRVAYSNVFGVPSSPATITGLNLDVQRYKQSPFSLTGDNDQRKAFVQVQGLNSSFFEHSIMEMITGLESISAVKALQIANETAVPVYYITNSNIGDVLPVLTVSQEVKTDIQNAVNAGKEVTISRDNVHLNDWTGVGYIVRDQNTGAGAYMISSGTAGTDTTQPAAHNALGLQAKHFAALAEGQPSRKWLGNSIDLFEADIFLMNDIGGMLLGKGYVPNIQQTFSRQKLLELANNKDNWIFYYSGHGGGDAESSFLVPLTSLQSDSIAEEFVDPIDIHTDVHIAFLNSCDSASTLSFVDSFNQGNSRDEVFLGWSESVDWVDSSVFGYDWWRNLYDGDTAEDAAINQNTEYTNYQNTIGPKLIIKGNKQTKI